MLSSRPRFYLTYGVQRFLKLWRLQPTAGQKVAVVLPLAGSCLQVWSRSPPQGCAQGNLLAAASLMPRLTWSFPFFLKNARTNWEEDKG